MEEPVDDAELAKRLGGAIKAARAARRWSQAELAERLDLGTKYVSLLESGMRLPSVPVLFRLARTLDLSLDDLARDRGRAAWASEAAALAVSVDPVYQPIVMDLLRAAARRGPPSREKRRSRRPA